MQKAFILKRVAHEAGPWYAYKGTERLEGLLFVTRRSVATRCERRADGAGFVLLNCTTEADPPSGTIARRTRASGSVDVRRGTQRCGRLRRSGSAAQRCAFGVQENFCIGASTGVCATWFV